ncbi:MAG: FimV/HubP family polar landmark protein [Marinagarivorans sp.]
MGLRKPTIFLSLISTLASPWVMGLGLGEIKLKSTLNQPLYAEIQLTQTKDLTDREILVGLASAADFARVGVERPGFLGDLKFQVVMEPGKGPLVRITSSKAVVEPYINFIVQAQWPSGKLLREYTVLVDLPTYGGDEAPSVAPAVSRPAANVPKVETQLNEASEAPRPRVTRPAAAATAPRPKAPRPAPVAQEPPVEAKASGDTYGPVADNDTLWKIARANRPSGASIQQTMLAIQKLNPDAFINGNINLLRKGQTLRLPAAGDTTQVTPSDAAQQVASTPPASRKAPAEESTGPQLDASKSVAKSEPKSANLEGRVKLSSSNSAESSKSGRGAGKDKGNKEALSNELTITKEELDAKSRESADLNARLKAVDEQIENTEKLIQVNSEEMRKLELAIEKNKQNATAASAPVSTETNPATAEVPAAISADGKVVAPTDPASATAPAEGGKTEGQAAAVSGQQSPSPETPKVDGPQETPPAQEPKPATVAQPSPAKAEPSGVVDLLKNNLLYIGGGLAVLLGLVLVLLKRRRGEEEDPAPWVSASDNAGDAWGADFSLPAFDETKPAETKSSEVDDTTAFQFASTADSVKLETDDVVSESDIHIALSDFDTAEKLLLSSLEQDPANSRVLLKLLEVYSRKQDVDSFDRQYAKLKAFCDEDSAARAEQLRSYIDNAPPFDAHKYSEEAFLAAVNGKLDGDDTTQLSPALAAAGVGGAVAAASFVAEPFADFDFDARLDPSETLDGVDTLAEEPTSADVTQFMQPVNDEESFTLDFEDPTPAPAADRKSLAELLADEGGEESLDLSDFDDLSFAKGEAPNTSLDEPGITADDPLADLDFSFEAEGLDESDFELDENALGNDFESIAADELHLDASLDAGFDDLDEPLAPAPVAELEDEFADLDLSALDYDLNEDLGDLDEDSAEVDLADLAAPAPEAGDGPADHLDLTDESAPPASAAETAGDDLDLSFAAEAAADPDLAAAMAELDALDEQTLDLDQALSELDQSLAAPAPSSSLESLLDFDADFGADLDASEAAYAPAEDLDEPNTPTLVMSAITDSDIAGADLDFDELDADLGALAAEFDGDLSDLDDLDAPTLADTSSAFMDEPVTQFGELDDVDPADILGDGPKERPEIDLADFDDSVTFAIEDPLTDLDAERDLSPSGDHFAAVAGELGTAVNLDAAEDLVEFEDLDNLDDLAELDLDSGDALAIDLDDDDLVIPRVSAADVQADFQLPDFDPESDDDSDLGALCDGDELDTKLDLLRAFVDMGDEDSAKHTLEEILEEGTEEQRKQAQALMERIS